MSYGPPTLIGLSAVMAVVLILPFSVRWIEEELEAFLLVMGCLAVTISRGWSVHLLGEALSEPLKISIAVLVFGLIFRAARGRLRAALFRFSAAVGLPAFFFLLVVVLGLASSVITAIVAALVLVETATALRLDRAVERDLVILACYGIGLGAVLTPIGEPLSTIARARLAGPPHEADFFFLGKLLWPWVAPGLLFLGLLAARLGRGLPARGKGLSQEVREDNRAVAVRAVKVYVFVAALVLLGQGLSPLVEKFLVRLPLPALYWANIASAALDNATLAAAELSPQLDITRIRAVLLALLVSGGMMIPGNIPNIICAGKLGLGSREWALRAVPLGLLMMTAYFAALMAAGVKP
jgi:predicted cation transporter